MKAKPAPADAEAKKTDRVFDFSQDVNKVAQNYNEDFLKVMRFVHIAEALKEARNKMPLLTASTTAPPAEEEEEEEVEEEGEETGSIIADQAAAPEREAKEVAMERVFSHLKKYDPKFEGCLASMSVPATFLRQVCQSSPPLHPRFSDGAEIASRETRLQEAAQVQTAAIHYMLQGIRRAPVNLEEAANDLVAATALSMHALSKLYAFMVADALDVSRDEAQTLSLLPSLPAETHSLLLRTGRFPGGGGGSTLPASRPAEASEPAADAKPREQRPLSAPPPVLPPLQPFPITPPRAPLGSLLPPTQGFPPQLRFAPRAKGAKPKPKKAAAAAVPHAVRT
jgi:hypothetical protein